MGITYKTAEEIWTDPSPSLESDARNALKNWDKIKEPGLNNVDNFTFIRGARELEYFLKIYVELHHQAKQNNQVIVKRRRDHWDVIKEKCESDPMFKTLWDELLVLLKLESEQLRE